MNRAVLKRTRALFQALPAGFTLSAADVPAFPNAKKLRSIWMPFDERCVPAAQTDRVPVQGNRAAAIAIASGPGWAKAENGNSMGKC
jgi:hypothetical protein